MTLTHVLVAPGFATAQCTYLLEGGFNDPPSLGLRGTENAFRGGRALGKNPKAKILSGGHSLLPMMKFRLASPPLLVDINRVDGLSYIREEGDWLKIGALTRESDLEASEIVQKKYPLLADTARVIADPLVRNMATVAGNLAHADPANDHPATMLAYGAQIVATGPKGEREIAISILAELVLIRRRSLIPGMSVETPAPPVREAGEAAATDPVCGMSVEVGSAQHLSDHAGQIYYFCCSGCKRSFDREPTTYLVKP